MFAALPLMTAPGGINYESAGERAVATAATPPIASFYRALGACQTNSGLTAAGG